MGCTPSIHVSQTGVVYCRESEPESNSPRASYAPGSYHYNHSHFIRPENSETTCGCGGRGKNLRLSVSEAETQTSQLIMKDPDIDRDLLFGKVKLPEKIMSVLLVFPKEDAQSEGFHAAAERLGFKASVARDAESGQASFRNQHPDVVIVDHRGTKGFDAEAFCRSIRLSKTGASSVFVAVRKKHTSDKEEPSILPLLKAGFDRKYTENSNVGACMNELMTLEHSEVLTRAKLHTCRALLELLNHVSDAVEITDSCKVVQFVNGAYEKMLGYGGEEIIGHVSEDLTKTDKNRMEVLEAMNSHLKKGKAWEGVIFTMKKSGQCIPLNSYIAPVLDSNGCVGHYVTVNSDIKSSRAPYEGHSVSAVSVGRRRESLVRDHSFLHDAPITKVISLITDAQEGCTPLARQSLEKVLEILRSSELYNPHFNHVMSEDDTMTSNYVGGLVSNNVKRRMSNEGGRSAHASQTAPACPPGSSSSLQVPDDIKTVLVKAEDWDLDIFELEGISNRRPLAYLGMKLFERFKVMEYLNTTETVMYNWLTVIESNYQSSNSYHNSTHAADVLQASAYFLNLPTVKVFLDQGDEIACLLAAAIHDVDHPGRTNAFLINANDNLAILYNDRAVLENHHAALAFQLTHKSPSTNIFQNVDNEEYRTMRANIIEMVLATEMKQHFEILTKFQAMSQVSNSYMQDTMSLDSGAELERKMLIKRMLLKCGDISNPVRPLFLCKEWALRIAEEYFQQTDDEKSRGLPVVMPVFDRKTCSIPHSQITFVEVFINDLFKEWNNFCDVPELLHCLSTNTEYWKEQLAQEQAKKQG